MMNDHTKKLSILAAALGVSIGSFAFAANEGTPQRGDDKPGQKLEEKDATNAENQADKAKEELKETADEQMDKADKMAGDKMSDDKMSGDKSMSGDKMSGDKMGGDMAANMQADKTVNSQLKQICMAPDMAGDKLFVLGAAAGNAYEVEFAKIVAERAEDQKVKDLAQMIMKDHQAAQDKLKPIAQSMNVQLPSALPSMTANKLEIFRQLPAKELEMCYLSDQKAAHYATVSMFEDAAVTLKNDQAKSYASEVLPKLKEHTSAILKLAADRGLPTDLNLQQSASIR